MSVVYFLHRFHATNLGKKVEFQSCLLRGKIEDYLYQPVFVRHLQNQMKSNIREDTESRTNLCRCVKFMDRQVVILKVLFNFVKSLKIYETSHFDTYRCSGCSFFLQKFFTACSTI